MSERGIQILIQLGNLNDFIEHYFFIPLTKLKINMILNYYKRSINFNLLNKITFNM